MCGIYGYIGSPESIKEYHNIVLKMFIEMGVETEIRGKHATGFYGICGNEVFLNKAPVPASDFYLHKEVFDSINKNLPSIMIGHNRHATHGDPKINSNNHPFYTSRFGFIHNGIVGRVTSPEKLGIRPETECDSEWIFRYFIKHFYNGKNQINTIKKTMVEFEEGDFACAMIDAKERKLFLFRNVGRPIAVWFNKKMNIIFFSSTKEIMIDSAKAVKLEINADDIYYLKNGRILQIDENLNIKKDLVEYTPPPPLPISEPYKYTVKAVAKKKNIVSDGKYPTCKKCGKMFLNESYLNNHIEKEHEHKYANIKKNISLTYKTPVNYSADEIKLKIHNRCIEIKTANTEKMEMLFERIDIDLDTLRTMITKVEVEEFVQKIFTDIGVQI